MVRSKFSDALVRGLQVSGYDPYSLRYICENFSLSALILGIGQAWLLVTLAGAVSGISKLQYFCRTELLCCCYILFSQSVSAHTTWQVT